jgi:hypothetical protein
MLELRVPDGVEWVKRKAPAEWALTRMNDRSELSLSVFMPSGFEGYVRILHPLGDRGGNHRSYRWTEVALASALPISPAAGLRAVMGRDRVTQEWLDEYGPLMGSLSERTCAVLVDVLRRFTSTPDVCLMAVWDGWGTWWPQITADDRAEGFRKAWERRGEIAEALRDVELIKRPYGRDYFLFRGDIDRARAFNDRSPQLGRPDDRAWFVSTEIDASSTYVGASSGCLEAILASPELEALCVPLSVPMDDEGW